jgi:DNA-binding transcriptional MocR family regulator
VRGLCLFLGALLREYFHMSETANHLYESLAARMAEAIQAGALKVGDRLPSVRRVSTQHRVSIATAVQAYRHLENQRLIEARPKSGYFVLSRPVALAEPTTSTPPGTARFVGVNQLVMEVLDSVRQADSVPLGAACPAQELFPTDKLLRLAHAEGRRKPQLLGAYAMSPGYEKLRAMIARRSLDFGCQLSPEEIIVTNGCIEALNLALRAVARPGDTIALESPTYFTLLQIIESLGMKALEIPTHPRDERISIAPGPMFTTTKRYRNCIRVGCGHLWSAKMEMGLMRLGQLAAELTGPR